MALTGLNYLHTQELRMAQLISLSIWVHSTWSQVERRVFCYASLCTGCSKRVFPSYPLFPFLFFLPPTPWRGSTLHSLSSPKWPLSHIPCLPCNIYHIVFVLGQHWSSLKVQEWQVPLTDLDLRLCSLFATLETRNVAPFCLCSGCPFLCILLCFPDILSLFFTRTWTGAVKSNVASDCTPSVLSQKQPFHTASVVFLKVFMHKWVPCVILRNTKCIALSIWVYELLFFPQYTGDHVTLM